MVIPGFREIEMNEEGRISTFSCFWYQCIFLNNGVTVFPGKSLVFNTGLTDQVYIVELEMYMAKRF